MEFIGHLAAVQQRHGQNDKVQHDKDTVSVHQKCIYTHFVNKIFGMLVTSQ